MTSFAPTAETRDGMPFNYNPWKHPRRRAFWALSPDQLVVAVLEPTADEPLLIACAALRPRLMENDQKGMFAPGIVELARSVCSEKLGHVVALPAQYSRLVEEDEAVAVDERYSVSALVGGGSGLSVHAMPEAVAESRSLFLQAGLRLEAVDCAATAVLNFRSYLGEGTEGVKGLDPLVAVSVAPTCEATASALGSLLSVPLGLALGRLGGVGEGGVG